MILYEKACAKINLFLWVGKMRDDGFHEISTYMHPVSLADDIKLEIESANKTEISLTIDGNPDIPVDQSNLVCKAAALFLEAANEKASINIELKKLIPSGAGLGGGSSDGAAVLRALNRFYNFRFSEAELTKMAAKLGSDVPFFISSKPALCEGRGEKLTKLHPTTAPYAVIVAGKEHSNTAVAYRLLDEWKEANSLCTVHLPDFNNFKASDIYNDLGMLHWRQSKLDVAKQYYLDSISISKNLLGEKNGDIASTYGNLGILYHDFGYLEQAEKFYQAEWILYW